MRKAVMLGFALALAATWGGAAQPADHMTMAPDTRTAVEFPSHMKDHMLANMRGHLAALQGIVAALAAGDAPAAGKIASERLGVESPGAAACVKPAANMSPAPGTHDMAAMMAKFMPEPMRAMGLAMHESASAFAVAAAKTPPGGDPRPALEALAQVTRNCVACHAAYRLN